MGVHDLWSIVEPVRESVPLYSLSGKTLAVDLSLWVCEAQHVQAMMGKVTKPHLRNLFFRVSTLTLMGIKLVFVMEGEAPKIKSETMSKRTETRYGGFRKGSKSAKSTSRGRFNAILRECAEMLDYLGVPWVTAAGEAEAMCAYLDSLGLVDGCITNDGDAFLYGARTVYRNFNMNSKDPQVDCYQTSRVQTDLHLSRENLVGLAILLGCDYIPKGIPGVGKEQSLRLIETLNGQSLLERFKLWKMVDVDPPDVVKKVLHCNICRHPGSAKAHEHAGCVFCDSQRFCQPQDFDYQCPCEWHGYERTRQASTLEANIRRKTLASQQFPFTEIIREFLVSKDKPVSRFKRRQANMLMMQKFAHEKMEWPKHYTSEKVLVLMTYTEMMNKKQRRDVSSQIKPIRIFKPRVRNGVASFEVIWSPPEHYVFPDDRPAEDQHEVRTVEEESLFRVAFPEIVESYIRSKALAEDTKKKKPKARKEKSSDVSEDYLDLFGRMTLQSSSVKASTQPQTLLPSTSSTQTEVICLDTPESHKQLRKENMDDRVLGSPLPHEESKASPSISAVIDALHLSDINWDALSFTSSPTSQENHPAESQQSQTSSRDETQITEQVASSDVKQEDSRSAAELCYTECPLRDRVLMRNAAKALSQVEKSCDVVSKHLNYESTPPKKLLQVKHSADISNTNSIYSGVTVQKSVLNKSQTNTFKDQQIPSLQTQNKTKETSDNSEKAPLKYNFVKTALSSSSDPGQSTRAPQTTKKSVCMSVCSSSDDSDTENHRSRHQRRAKTNKVTSSFLSDLPLKQVSNQLKTKSNLKTSYQLQRAGPSSLNHGDKNDTPVSSKNKQNVPTPETGDDACPQTPVLPVTDSEDSLICSDSPLPLAERLRLKNLK